MSTRTKQILQILKVVAWIIFIGLCIKAGALTISFVVSLFNPEAVLNLYLGMDLSEVYTSSFWKYVLIASLLIAIEGLKAYLFYLVVELLSGINLVQPFSTRVSNLLMKISGIALEIGILVIVCKGYANWLFKTGIDFHYDGSGTEFLFLSGIVFVIAQIFKRGLELQTESEFTV